MRLVMEQKQMLKMVMTTELRQAIELLQLSTYELFEYVQQEAEENPFIECIDNEPIHMHDNLRPKKRSVSQRVDPIDIAREKEKSLHDQLLEQLAWFDLTEETFAIVHYLVLNLNEQGFLTMDNTEITAQLGIDETTLLDAKQHLHQLEPYGIGAKDLSECLWIQAKKSFPDNIVLHEIIADYLQPLADKQWQRIASQLDIPLSAVRDAFNKIQTLNPRPAAAFAASKIDYVTPDITIRYNEENDLYEIVLNDHYIPNIHFNWDYSRELPESKEVSQYVNDHFRRFSWLEKSILQRRDTILKIMNVIIRYQADFLKDGFRSLKPLTLRDVAEEIDMHESTVSRATANKIIETPAGTFELKHLFSTKLATRSGHDTSQTTVKEQIRDLIEKEDKYKPLSDQKIADELKQAKDVVISRRTVAKYRDELNIPSSSKRKEIKIS